MVRLITTTIYLSTGDNSGVFQKAFLLVLFGRTIGIEEIIAVFY
jgi:hypothetical protein